MHRAACIGRRIDVWAPRCGVVHSAFAGAVNLRLQDAWWTLLAPDRGDQPSGIRLAADAPGLASIRAGSPVRIRAGHVRAGNAVIDCRAAKRWSPGPWPAAAPGIETRLQRLELDAKARAWTGSAGLAEALCEALAEDDEALSAAARRTVGCGPGLTPSGDDVIVGVLTALAMRAAPARERLARALAPALVTTTDLSRHLIAEAALGLPGRALYELGAALLSGADLAGLTRRALDVGATSGADAAVGLVAGLRHLLAMPERTRA